MAAVITFIQGLGLLAIAPMTPYLIEAFDTDLFGVVRFTGITILVLGFSNFLWSESPSSLGCGFIAKTVCQGSPSVNFWKTTCSSSHHSHLLG